jgi:hypothetical protein
MFIRFEDSQGDGVYQSEFLEKCADLGECDLIKFFNFLGGVTRAPKQYGGAIPGHQCRGVDIEFSDLMTGGTRFAWDLDFFKQMVSGKWSKEQKAVASNFDLEPLRGREQFVQLVSTLADLGINILLLDGTPIYRTEQQALYYPNHMQFVDCLGIDDVQLLMDVI